MVMCGHMKVVTTLLEAGARVGEANHQGNTALHWATVEGHIPIVTALLAYMGQPLDPERGTAGDHAKRFGQPAVAAVLEEAMGVPSLLQACSKVIIPVKSSQSQKQIKTTQTLQTTDL